MPNQDNGPKAEDFTPQVLPEPRITFNQQTGRTEVTGPLDNSFLCYGMLESAKEIVMARSLKKGTGKSVSSLVIPQMAVPIKRS